VAEFGGEEGRVGSKTFWKRNGSPKANESRSKKHGIYKSYTRVLCLRAKNDCNTLKVLTGYQSAAMNSGSKSLKSIEPDSGAIPICLSAVVVWV